MGGCRREAADRSVTPLLRSPPFPGVAPAVAAISAGTRTIVDEGRLPALLALIRDAGVAGDFWTDTPARTPDEARLIAAIARGDAAEPGLAASLLAPAWRDPFTDRPIEPEAAVAILRLWREVIVANRGIRAAAGMAWWKRDVIRRFLWDGSPLAFVRTTAAARAAGGAVAVWPSRSPAGLSDSNLPLVFVEDGFVRSIGLGANLHPPFSIAVDHGGIHYDPSRPSDLETILQTHDFPPELLARAEALAAFIVTAGISKYGVAAPAVPVRRDSRRLVLVPGQVEDDMSVRLGGAGIASNIDLLARVRAAEPDARILFKPHPDVDAGHRRGWASDADLLVHADEIVRGQPMPDLLARVDAVHVLTSLTGFEALLRGVPVTTHGQPFFAGWGLTTDLARRNCRRTRRLSLAQLIAGVLILYPRYMDPITGLPCAPEILLARFTEQARPRMTWLVRVRQVQGRVVRVLGVRRSVQ
jgi:capsular polysaccharide export protein